MTRIVTLLLVTCGESMADPGSDAGHLVRGAGESEVFCGDLLPESLGGARRYGDHGAFGCHRADGEDLVVGGARWDHVDEIAAHLVGAVLRVEPEPTSARLRAWSTSDDLWLRRTALLAQLGFGAAVDRALLEACFAPPLERPEV